MLGAVSFGLEDWMRVYRLTAGWTAAAVLFAAAAAAQVTTEQVPGITNFKQVKSTVACAGATTPESMRAVKDMGFAAVVNLRQASEKGADIEAETAAAQAAGLTYIHIPMNGAAPDPAVVDRFLAAARTPANNPMFVHCASGNRAAAVWLVRRVLVDGWAVDKASEEAEALGLTSAPLKQFALDYVATNRTK
jgi:uncharacterized protein (TIGR01244 family)